MATPMPAPSPEGEPLPEDGRPRFIWVPGSQDENGVEVSGPVSPEEVPGYEPEGSLPAGLDWKALIDGLAAAGRLGSLDDEEPEAQHDKEITGPQERTGLSVDPGQLAAQVVEHMPPGPALGGWLEVAASAAPQLDEYGLTGLAIAAGKQAAHAQAVQLAAVAQLTARAAAADRNVGLTEDGRPAQVTRDAAGQVEMGLMLSHDGAQALADLAVTLTWRLAATGRCLANGQIDLIRARIIAQYTGVLGEDLARQVEAKILPAAAGLTTAQLRRRLAVLVIAADPEGAEERRKNAEQHADVRLYADDDHTAALIADKLPQVHAAAAYGRINALAWARKKAGLPGSVRQHRAHILLELLLGTLEFIPPADGAPPDQPPPPDDQAPPRDGQQPPGDKPSGGPGPDDGLADPGSGHDDPCPGTPGPSDDIPAPGDEDAPTDDGLGNAGPDDPGSEDQDPEDQHPCRDDDSDGLSPDWPALGTIPAALARASRRPGGTPPAALLDVTLPWTSYAGLGDLPGSLGQIGAITAAQARLLARAAEYDSAAEWRIIITDHDGHAITVTRIRRRTRTGPDRRGPPGTGPPGTGPPETGPGTGPPAGAGLAGRVTLTISQDTINSPTPARSRTRPPPGSLAAVALRAARRALQRAQERAAADTAAGGCAHSGAAAGYRPPPRLREHVIARDLTCRSGVCGQPAWRADLDHTVPYDQGGRTCRCNLGGVCRREHQLKQHPRWTLTQTRPGWFVWTAPSGRTYQVGPQAYLS